MSMESVSLLPCTSLTISTSCQSRNFSKLHRDRRKSKFLHVRKRASSVKSGIAMCATGVGEKDGVIIVDHGSRRSESNLMLNEFVVMFREKTGYPIVEPAHMDTFFGEILGAVFLAGNQSLLNPTLQVKPVRILAEGVESRDGEIVIDEKHGRLVKILENIDPSAYYDLLASRFGVQKQSAVIGSFDEQRRIWSQPPNS